MYRYPDGTIKLNPPTKLEFAGFIRKFADLTREQRDGLGYNEAVPVARDPFTTYTTEWAKGADMIYREEITSAVVDEAARAEHEAGQVRAERDRLLAGCDWTQVADAPVDQTAWAAYRQALRDVPEQEGFPGAVEWPGVPE
ncbi:MULTISPECIES: tail fiber assembly protein [unclassified Pseudodesulfovibrio]|uniref:tail fiber assembly protein n=1 Tax=unclassified Pseudodesulfovibrio TaxID=2661612 RepID=UPI000FEBC69F|nr:MULTISPECIES: tail fiber assembly protein [unclassified Pseudodesulfovibrio]MCJ2165535.1 phage tail assembly chaperone [Pseudodesulfovibrio sp. S3-i]RWU03104.1 hypothetical protein DWB63_12930 [Pseudodesulfovibrio sp. S3]